ncbi:histidine kinase [Actinosynnema sp. NPDC020468]|uniref:sensor histidine kinase n=1 Tax=Actinosynnema sp. NPDC020468 TaxID=3154488 RepID=UPI00340F626D
MIRTFLEVVLLPDRARVFGDSRFRRVGYGVVWAYALVIAIGTATDYVEFQEPAGWWPLLFALTAGPLALLPFSALTAWRVATLGLLPFHLLLTSEPALLGPWQWCWYLPVALFVGLTHSGRVTLLVAALTGVALWAVAPGKHEYFLITTGTLAVVFLLGFALGSRGRAERRFHAERDEKVALQERARIAREMHDVVAHHMSMVVVRCETAPYRLAGLSPAAAREFGELGEAARSAIGDMQRLLGVLRTSGQVLETAPQPGLRQVVDLFPDAEVADVEVSEAVGLTAYRVVQEALTNARRHAPGAPVSVLVTAADGVVDVVVRNGAGGPSLGGGGGHGLAGMRERVAVHGGSVEAGARDGGFEVRAWIPLERP